MGQYQYRRDELKWQLQAGLLAMATEVGLDVFAEMLEDDATEVAGPRGKHQKSRTAVRHGSERGAVTLGGRRVQITHPRVRTTTGKEVQLPSYVTAASRDLLNKSAMERMLAGLSTRHYPISLEPVGDVGAHGISKSSISRRFIQRTQTALDDLMNQHLGHLKPVALMVDGVGFAKTLCVVALVIDAKGIKHPVGILEGATENDRVVTDLLVDLKERGLDVSDGILVVIDGAKALASAVRKVFGKNAVIQRCIEHKIRNVKDYLPKEQHEFVSRKMRQAYQRDAAHAERDLKALANRLEETNLSAARSLREGLYETLTINRLEVAPTLMRTLRSTNAIESLFETVRSKHRNVKHWRPGTMALRWAAAGVLDAQARFRRVEGYRHLPALARALYRHVHPEVQEEVA